MAVVGNAQVLIQPSFKGFQKQIAREAGVGGKQGGREGGRSLGSELLKWGKRGAVVAGGAIAGVAGTALVKGFGRLQAIENAQAKLRGLGHDADGVKVIMDNALASVKGTAFGLGEAASVAAAAVAAGIKPGEELTGHLSNVANNAAAAGISMGEMGAIFNRAATQVNGVQNDVISQLADRGIPIYQELAKQMGVTAGEVFNMASRGEVDFETFSKAAEAAAGSVADEMGGTLTGSFQNVLAALGRVGANLLSGVYPYFAEFFQGVQDFLGPLEESASAVGEAVGKWFASAAEAVKGFLTEFQNGEGAGGRFREVLEGLWEAAKSFGGWVRDTFLPVLQDLASWIKDDILPAVGDFIEGFADGEGAGGAFRDVLETVGDVIQNVVGYLRENTELVWGAVAAYTAWKVAVQGIAFIRGILIGIAGAKQVLSAATYGLSGATYAHTAATRAGGVALLVQRGALVAHKVATVASTVATKAATVAQRAFNLALRANPLGLLATAIAAVVAGLVYFFTQTETGRAIITAVWDGIKSVISSVWEWLQGVWQGMVDLWETVTTGISDFWNNTLMPIWDAFRGAVQSAWDAISPIFTSISNAFQGVGNFIRNVVQNVILLAWDLLKFGINLLWRNVLLPAFNGIRSAFQAVGDAFMWVWRNLIKPAWDFVAAGARWLWNNVLTPIFDSVKAGFRVVGSVLQWVWQYAIKGAFEGWATIARWLWNSVLSPIFGWISDKWDRLGGAIGRIWRENIRPVLQRFGDFVKEDLVGNIQRGVDWIGDAVRKVANFFRRPINWVINTVWNDGLKKAFDGVANAINSSATLPRVNEIPAFAKGGRHKGGLALVGEEGPELVNLGPSRVWTAAQTQRMLSQGRDLPPTLARRAAGRRPEEAVAPMGGILRRVGSALSSVAGAAVSWVRGGLASAAGALLRPIVGAIGRTVGQWGPMGALAGDAGAFAVDKLLDWIRGKDEEAAAEGEVHGGPPPGRGGWVRPSRGPVTSRYGPRWGSFHAGIDIAGGGPVYAANDGTVYKTGSGILVGRTGLGIGISHGGGVFTYYGHNPVGGIRVRPGQRVRAGQHIGAQGATGNVTGIHTHFELHRGGWGRNVNPEQLGVFDNGGILKPGMWGYNASNKPEPVFSSSQWDIMRRNMDSGNGGVTIEQNFYGMERDTLTASVGKRTARVVRTVTAGGVR